MATTTPNYGLTKPAATDNYDITVPNGNMDIIDAQLKANADAVKNVSHAAMADTATNATSAAGYTADGGIAAALAGKAPTSAIPAASTTAPAMDGTASAGTSGQFARGDHVHPTDTSQAADSDLTTARIRAYMGM